MMFQVAPALLYSAELDSPDGSEFTIAPAGARGF
jgi:hypothetical protein